MSVRVAAYLFAFLVTLMSTPGALALQTILDDSFESGLTSWTIVEGEAQVTTESNNLRIDAATSTRTIEAKGITDFHTGAIRVLFYPFNNGNHDAKVFYPNEGLQIYIRYAGPDDYTLLTLKPYNNSHIGYYLKAPGTAGDGTMLGYLEWGNTYDNKWLDALVTVRATTLTVAMRGTPYETGTDTFSPNETYRDQASTTTLNISPGAIRIGSALTSEHPLLVGEVSIGKMGAVKKVYADYHAYRYTRPHDGKLGIWKYSGSTSASSVTPNNVNFNADLIDSSGQHQIASSDYPEVGMQSTLDPDYLEYQVLLAKAAHIDGFMVEWPFQANEANDTLLAMLPVAERLGFELGVNWTDGNAFAWLPYATPPVTDRAAQVDYLKTSYQYLLDNLYNTSSAALYNGHPLALVFGGGFTPSEFQEVRDHAYALPAGLATPWFFKWAPIGAVSSGSTEMQYYKNDFHDLLSGPFGWTTPMLREDAVNYPDWDEFALTEDTKEYVRAQMQSFLDYGFDFKLHVSSVSPGFDNRPCASWGAWKLSYLDREDGVAFTKMWQANLENRDWIDVILIATWNDFTESTHIEPTVEQGDRELRTTEQYAAQFKDIASDSSGIDLPLRIFHLRKEHERLDAIGLDVASLGTLIEDAVTAAATLDYATADSKIAQAEVTRDTLVDSVLITTRSVELTTPGQEHAISSGLALTVGSTAATELQDHYFKAYLLFEYFDSTQNTLQVKSATDRGVPYDIVCDIKKDNTGTWKSAMVEVFHANSTFDQSGPSGSDLYFTGDGSIRNVRLEYGIYKQPGPTTVDTAWTLYDSNP